MTTTAGRSLRNPRAREPRTFATAEALAAGVADIVTETIRSARAARLVLAGGTRPRRCYELLAARDLPSGRVTILFSDERCVPPSDPESNYRAAAEALVARVSPASVHRMRGELGAEAGAALYEPAVGAAPLDVALLGIGPDGHTASLFPGNVALEATGLVAAVHGAPKPPPDRITLTLRALRGARRVLILAAGADKRDALRRALAGEVPAGMVPHAEWLVTAETLASTH